MWLRHSYAFLERKYSPELILKIWSQEVHLLLKKEWDKIFSAKDSVALATMGKLGSGELNLSSDIDLIFFSGEQVKNSKFKEFIKVCSSSATFPSGFKIDLDLRPGGKNAPLVCTLNQFGVHLWNQSDPWERYSYTRMAVPFGPQELIAELEKIRDQFCYRRYLRADFFHRFLNLREGYKVEKKDQSVNLKLGAGGIRDVELFVQTFQILYGGKNPAYKKKSTFELLDLLIENKIHPEMFHKIKLAYLVLRQAEGEKHALKEQAGFDWNLESENELTQEILNSMNLVDSAIHDFSKSSNNLFGRTNKTYSVSSFERVVLDSVSDESRDKVAANLKNYFSEKNRMFSYYRSAILNQDNMKQAFIDLLVYSDYGCRVLSRRPSLLDLFFLRHAAHSSQEVETYENLGDAKMVQRILASNHFAKTQNLTILSENVSNAYEYILKQVLDPKEGFDILFMGKMATREMGLKSDLDFILVVDDKKTFESSDLSKKARELYKKLSFPTFFGPLVPFDTQGGPMGRATPLVMTLSSLKKHLIEKAPAWQKLMYLKHRFLFDSQRKLEYLKQPLKPEDFQSLFAVLSERLKLPDRVQDPLKLGKGGLFHTEFITSALYLKVGVQPLGQAKMKDICIHFEDLFAEKDLFSKLNQNYQELFKARELGFVKSADVVADLQDLRRENFFILEELSDKLINERISGV